MLTFVSVFLLLVAYPLVGTAASVWLLVASQLMLLAGQIRRGQVSGVGGFIFMSFLFFGVRPVYMLVESDYMLFTQVFQMRVGLSEVSDALWWASAALLCFALGAALLPLLRARWLRRRRTSNASIATYGLVSAKACGVLMVGQLMTLPVMLYLAGHGRSLYRSAFGAYLYDLPVPLQAIHIITLVVLFDRFLRRRSDVAITMLGVSGVLFMVFTWLMRDVSMFRGFYVAGVMIAGIAILQLWRGRVGFAWLILPVVLLQPFFQYLGQTRGLQNEELAELGFIDAVFERQTVGEAYWKFYSCRGDMNIFDTFVAAKQTEPAFYATVWSWLYVPLHFIPRTFWKEKPKNGITMDMNFTRGAPFSPGIAGIFLRDGGLLWMLFSMFVLGYLLSWLDWYVLTMPRGYLQYCLVGVVTVNAMFLSRFFLFQYFYQMLYAIIPIVALAWWFGRSAKQAQARQQRGAHMRQGLQQVKHEAATSPL